MGRMYTVVFSGTLTNAGGDSDLFELNPADDKPIRLRGYILSQTSEIKDAEEEALRISVMRLPATVTSGSGGSSATPVPLDPTDTAAGFTAEVNNTTVATTSGSAVTLIETSWNVRISPNPEWFPDERFAPMARQGDAIVIRCQSTVTDDISINITAWVEEY